MALIKKYKNGKTEIEIYSSEINIEEQKKNLIDLYNSINQIANNQTNIGNNVDNWFYSKAKLQKMKESGKYNFL